jgi:tRNA(Ile)-lysidine synthase
MMNPFEVSIAAVLGNNFRGQALLAAVSGGADSTAMLIALAALRPELGFTLHCLHVDHGIRSLAESRGDREFVEDLCKNQGVPCTTALVPPGRIERRARELGIGLEAAARIYRRRAWNREARRIGAAAVLTAHTRDDLLETVLMRVLRGSGPAGLAAMPVRRGRILRPLLELSRGEVLVYLEDRGLSYRTDRSNSDNRFLRNLIRNKLIPALDGFFPRWRTGVASLAETQRLAADFLFAEAGSRVSWEPVPGARGFQTGAEGFFSLPPILREEALFLGIDRLLAGPSGAPGARGGRGGEENPARVKRSNLRAFSRGNCPALDLGFCRIRKTPSRVILSPGGGGGGEAGFSLLIKAPGLYKLKGVTLELTPPPVPNAGTAGFFVSLPMILRQAFRGDRLSRGGRKTGVSGLEAGGLPVFCAADAAGVAAFIGAGPRGGTLLLGRPGEPEAEKRGGARGSGDFSESGAGAGLYYCKIS